MYLSSWSMGMGKSGWLLLYRATLRQAWCSMEKSEPKQRRRVKSMMCSIFEACSKALITRPVEVK